MKRWTLYILVLGMSILNRAFPMTSPDTTIRHVRIYGLSIMRTDDILRVMSMKRNGSIPEGWPDKSMGALVAWYHRMGYFFMRIDSVKMVPLTGLNVFDMEIWLDEGKRIRVGSVQLLNGQGEAIPGISRGFETRSGQFFDPDQLETDMDALLTRFENMGFPLAEIEIRSFDIDMLQERPTVHMNIVVNQGSLIVLGRVEARGNDITRDRVITRELMLKIGEPFDNRVLKRAGDQLRRSGMFRRVEEPTVRFAGNKAIVTMEVEDGNSNTVDGVIGYLPARKEGEKGSITGRIHLSFRNLLGTGRFFEAFWQKKDDYSQAMRFRFEEPWILRRPVHAGIGFSQEIRDSTYIERAWNLHLRVSPRPTLSFLVEGLNRQVLPDSVGSQSMGVARSETWGFSGIVDYNTLDDAWNPRTGIRYRTAITLGWKHNKEADGVPATEDLEARVTTRRIEADAEICLNPLPAQVVYLGLHGVEVRTGDRFVPLSDQIRIGGTTTVRGYREDVFRGSLVAWSNLEYRLLVDRRSRVFVFMDAGVFQRKEEGGTIRGTMVGYGLGIRLQTAVGLFGIDLGLGKGDGLMDAKVHVGLLNRF